MTVTGGDSVTGGETWRPGRRGEEPLVDEATFRSYYGLPVIKQPVWEAADIAGYLFLGGLAGASSVIGAAAHATNRPSLARALKVTSTAAIGLSGVALVHDLGRPARFINMLRVFKPTSPMSVGSWLLATYAPMSVAASFSAVTRRGRTAGSLGTAGAAVLGCGVATYTAALVSNTSVPAWHDAYREMPFVFAASATSAAAGAGLMASALDETAPVKRLGIAAGAAELALMKLMKKRMGLAAEVYTESNTAHRYERAAQLATGAGIAGAVLLGGRSRLGLALAGAGLVLGSAFTRFAIFEAGVASAQNPRYTIEPQRTRKAARPAAR
ncbi:MAG TPA: NrfD/PsrC family molybdoenzyme membrane anchor subunit [Acidimicrobiales bacterium]|nr:NrfD/PsrC family molybdoenzyme membrane anchor subunit [Acidimicrobiales bacterium]